MKRQDEESVDNDSSEQDDFIERLSEEVETSKKRNKKASRKKVAKKKAFLG